MGTSCRHWLIHLLGFSIAVILIFSIGLVSAIINQWVLYPLTSSSSASSTSCSNIFTVDADTCPPIANQSCYVGLLSADEESCIYLPRPSTSACQSACYIEGSTTTYCNGEGFCEGDTTECRGACNHNNDGFDGALNNDIINSYDHTTFWTYVWFDDEICFYGRAVLSIIDIFAGTTEEALFHNASQPYTFVPLGARYKCEDYLEPAFVALHGECIQSLRYLIDTNLTNWALFTDYFNQTVPAQFSSCLFYYSCAHIEEEELASVEISSPQTTFKSTSEGWGFTPVESVTTLSDEHRAFSASPFVRSHFWNLLRDRTRLTLVNTPTKKRQAIRTLLTEARKR
jgi:hypothetical protein